MSDLRGDALFDVARKCADVEFSTRYPKLLAPGTLITPRAIAYAEMAGTGTDVDDLCAFYEKLAIGKRIRRLVMRAPETGDDREQTKWDIPWELPAKFAIARGGFSSHGRLFNVAVWSHAAYLAYACPDDYKCDEQPAYVRIHPDDMLVGHLIYAFEQETSGRKAAPGVDPLDLVMITVQYDDVPSTGKRHPDEAEELRRSKRRGCDMLDIQLRSGDAECEVWVRRTELDAEEDDALRELLISDWETLRARDTLVSTRDCDSDAEKAGALALARIARFGLCDNVRLHNQHALICKTHGAVEWTTEVRDPATDSVWRAECVTCK